MTIASVALGAYIDPTTFGNPVVDALNPQQYTPALQAATTNPNLGTGATRGGWYIDGPVVHGGGYIQFGSSGVSAGSGSYYITLPVLALGDFAWGQASGNSGGGGSIIGSWGARDVAPGTAAFGFLQLGQSGTGAWMLTASGTFVNNSSPWAWAASDAISFQFSYLAA